MLRNGCLLLTSTTIKKDMRLRHTSDVMENARQRIGLVPLMADQSKLLTGSAACTAGISIADDGTVEFRKEERVEFSHVVRSKHIGESFGNLVCVISWVTRKLQRWSCLSLHAFSFLE